MTAQDHSSPMLDIAAARALATSLVDPITETEDLPLAAALGRFCAETLHSTLALPRRARAAMDGFALRLSDLRDGQGLPIAGTIAAGAEAPDLPAGACLRIFTGALVPAGADAVLPVEDCTEEGATLRLSRRPEPGENIRAPGSEQPAGGVLLRAHARIAPQHVGLLAANGITRLRVLRRPRVGVFSTGDELDAQSPDSLPDSNRPMLLALAAAAGAEVTDLGLLPDDLPAVTARLADLRGQDLILTSGAVSMGGRDHLRPALIAAGGRIDGWRVAIKPGKPILFGELGPAAITGLPGNPFSAFTGFHLFAAAQLATLTGQIPPLLFPLEARAGFDWSRKPGRGEVFPVRLAHGEIDGMPVLQRLGAGVSATLFPLAEAEGLAFVPAETSRVGFGARLRWMPFVHRGV
ncbi:molybdopterin molybdotransferase [Rhodobacter viridis]|uniref:Molybdopterin molybdenumtransferase n=1 Tax=Rhodobacter viridis TaxID=1054202 RepID=A0A318TZU7_9RHOB|nr:gephyrin-like molybdotransferase Glp [Rhodobacter viridis]PYF10926.1 molybdopterin molybdotransferase [Rhodobacter viridis]